VEGLFGKRGLQSFVYEVAILELQVMKYPPFTLLHVLGCILAVFSHIFVPILSSLPVRGWSFGSEAVADMLVLMEGRGCSRVLRASCRSSRTTPSASSSASQIRWTRVVLSWIRADGGAQIAAKKGTARCSTCFTSCSGQMVPKILSQGTGKATLSVFSFSHTSDWKLARFQDSPSVPFLSALTRAWTLARTQVVERSLLARLADGTYARRGVQQLSGGQWRRLSLSLTLAFAQARTSPASAVSFVPKHAPKTMSTYSHFDGMGAHS
jgi:hypothetical protein